MSTPEMQNSIRVALADDQALVRAGLRALLLQQGIVVVFEADDGADLVLKLAQQPVDVVLSDIRMPGTDGIQALQQLRERGDPTPVLLLTTFDDSEWTSSGTWRNRCITPLAGSTRFRPFAVPTHSRPLRSSWRAKTALLPRPSSSCVPSWRNRVHWPLSMS